MVRELHAAFVGEPSRISMEVELEPIELSVERAIPCALILNELVSNAFKHAFPGERKGEVRISLQESEPGHLETSDSR